MIKKVIFVGFVAILMAGCEDSDKKAPTISAENAYSCAQLNEFSAQRYQGGENRIISSSIRQLDNEYAEDTTIQKFYRNFIREDMDYAVAHHQEVKETCLSNPEMGLADAATKSLNVLYSEYSKKPRWAMCRSFNDEEFDFNAVMEEMKNPSDLLVGGDPIMLYVKHVYKNPNYGESYIKEKVTTYCADHPDERLWSSIGKVTRVASNAIEEKRMQEEKARKKAAAKAEFEKNVDLYGSDLVKMDRANCPNLNEQAQLAEQASRNDRYTVFKAALISTTKHLSDGLAPWQVKKFDELMAQSPHRFSQAIASQCVADKGGLEDLKAAAARDQRIAMAVSDRTAYLAEKIRENRGRCDYGDNYCDARVASKAARDAFMANKQCESGAPDEGTLCFNDGPGFYQYALEKARLANTKKKIAALEALIDDPGKQARDLEIKMMNLVEDCKKEAIANDLRGSDYRAYVNEACKPEAKAKVVLPYQKEIQQEKNRMTVIQKSLEEAASKTVSNRT